MNFPRDPGSRIRREPNGTIAFETKKMAPNTGQAKQVRRPGKQACVGIRKCTPEGTINKQTEARRRAA
jgi:hypothetical protein